MSHSMSTIERANFVFRGQLQYIHLSPFSRTLTRPIITDFLRYPRLGIEYFLVSTSHLER